MKSFEDMQKLGKDNAEATMKSMGALTKSAQAIAELLDAAAAVCEGWHRSLDDDGASLQRILRRALEEGLHLLPDGRLYVSAAHTDQDIEATVGAFERVFG